MLTATFAVVSLALAFGEMAPGGSALGQTSLGASSGGGCTVECGAESTPEGEPQCADFSVPCEQASNCPGGEACVDGFCLFEDRVNGGCGAPSPQFTPLACGDLVCGSSGTFCGSNCDCTAPEDVNGDGVVDLLDVMCQVDGLNGNFTECPLEDMDVAPCSGDGRLALADVISVLRFISGDPGCCAWRTHVDTDWYEIELTSDSLVTLTLEAEFAASLKVFAAAPTPEDPCVEIGVTGVAEGAACTPITWARCLLPGKYYVMIAPGAGEDVACGATYTLEMGCDSCGLLCDPSDGDCCTEAGNGTAGCEDVDCCLTVCDVDPSCCSRLWDAECSALAREVCGACPPPASDDCVDAQMLILPSEAEGTTIGATDEVPLPPDCTSVTVESPGVWYTVTGTGNTMTASLCNSADFDTKLSVYCAGCDVLTCVAANNDRLGCGGFTSRVDWCSQPGADYQILIHGWNGATGNFTLNVFDNGTPCAGAVDCGVPICGDGTVNGHEECDDGNTVPGDGCDENCMIEPPPNDECADAILVTSGDIPVNFSTVGAHTDGPPHDSCLFSGSDQIYNDVWFDHVAECTGTLRVETCGSSIDTRMAIYSACECPVTDAIKRDCDNDTCGFQSRVVTAAVEGRCYRIRVGSNRETDFGPAVLSFTCETSEPTGACCLAGVCIETNTQSECDLAGGTWFIGEDCATYVCMPDYDVCEGRISLPCNGSVEVDNTNATTELDDPIGSCWLVGGGLGGIGTVFLEFVAETQTMRIRTDVVVTPPADDSELAVYEVDQANVCDTSAWNEIGCSEDDGSGAGAFNGDICVSNLIVGNRYILELATFAPETRGRYTVTTECPCPPAP